MRGKLLIISNDSDRVTDDVIEWIKYFDPKCGIDKINSTDFTKTISLNSNSYDSVWYRKVPSSITHFTSNDRDNFVLSELKSQHVAYLKSYSFKKGLGTVDGVAPNKILTLRLAKTIGLSVPDTILTSSKKDLKIFYNNNKEVIFKCISDPIVLKEKGRKMMLYTSLLVKEELDQLSEFFFPTLFQQRIVKEYEIRIFFINDCFYSMAIFSSKNKKTEVDFRVYDFENPNRTVPYELPDEIKQKLISLMSLMELNTGSIDLMKGVDGKYYFLEVNPVGQFDNLSRICNYRIEKEIAKLLIKQ
jgi:ATP-GRASP peptide maturase of grasp-with-spasm system